MELGTVSLTHLNGRQYCHSLLSPHPSVAQEPDCRQQGCKCCKPAGDCGAFREIIARMLGDGQNWPPDQSEKGQYGGLHMTRVLSSRLVHLHFDYRMLGCVI